MKKAYLKTLSSLVLLSLILALSLTLTSCKAGSKIILSAEELSANALAEENKDEEYAYSYFDSWEFPSFSAGKLKRIENIYRKYYYKELPSAYELATLAAKIFIEHYYENTELTDSDKVTDALISSYVAAIGDPYSFYRTKPEYQSYSGNMSGTFVGVGITVSYSEETGEMKVTAPIKNSPAEEAGILAGDIVVAIDGARVSDIGYEAALERIKGEKGTEVTLTVLRDGSELSFTMKRAPLVDISVDYRITEDKIGYIDIDSFKKNTDEQFCEAIDYMKENGARVIVYDVRDNGGGYLDTVVNMLDYIAEDGITLASFSNDYEKPYIADDGHSIDLPAVILCNRYSASASELFLAGMRDLGAASGFAVEIVGENTYGKGIMQTTFRLSDKSAITLTVAYYFPPSGDNFDGEGIPPTTEVIGAAEQRRVAFELAAAYCTPQ